MDIKSRSNDSIEIKDEYNAKNGKRKPKNGKLLLLLTLIIFSAAFMCLTSKQSKYDIGNYANKSYEIQSQVIRYAKNLDRLYIFFGNFDYDAAVKKLDVVKLKLSVGGYNVDDKLETPEQTAIEYYYSYSDNNSAEAVEGNYNNYYGNEYSSDEDTYKISITDENLEEGTDFELPPEYIANLPITEFSQNKLLDYYNRLSEIIENYESVKNYIDSNKDFQYRITDGKKVYTNNTKFEDEDYYQIFKISDTLFQDTYFNGEYISNAFARKNMNCQIIIPVSILDNPSTPIAAEIERIDGELSIYKLIKLTGFILTFVFIILMLKILSGNREELIYYNKQIYSKYSIIPFTVKILAVLLAFAYLLSCFELYFINLPSLIFFGNYTVCVLHLLVVCLAFIVFFMSIQFLTQFIKKPAMIKNEFEFKIIAGFIKNCKYLFITKNYILAAALGIIIITTVFGTLILVAFTFYNVRYGFALMIMAMIIAAELSIAMCIMNLITSYCKLSYYISECAEGKSLEIPERLSLFDKPLMKIKNINEGVSKTLEAAIKNERLKTELITNVSHDLKTPLTSIISYIDLLKNLRLNDKEAIEYIDILDKKAERLKYLIDDLFEASKLSAGQMVLEKKRVNITELFNQTIGEMSKKIELSDIEFKLEVPDEPIFAEADGQKLWRVFENLLNNILKYSAKGTRAYVDIINTSKEVCLTFKNISGNELNFDPDELFERFKRGDIARTTEGSGLGLSIAKNIVELHGGTMRIQIDGDLFKVTVNLPL